MHAARRTLVTEQEFLQLPESLTKTELVDGEVISSPAPSPRHQELVRRFVRALEGWAESREAPPTILFAPVDIRFRPGRILQPDIALWLDALVLPEEGPIDVVPDLCVEVISSNRVHDRVTKRLIYAAAGVKEYWTVERRGPVERWTGEGLDEVEALEDHSFPECLSAGERLSAQRALAQAREGLAHPIAQRLV